VIRPNCDEERCCSDDGKLGVVEDIEKLRAELQVQAVENLGAFGEREVYVPELRTEDRVPSQVSKCPICWLLKCRPIQVSDKIRCRVPIGVDWIHPSYNIRALMKIGSGIEIVVEKCAGIIRAHNRHRTAALCGDNRIQRPSLSKTFRTKKLRNLVSERRREAMARIKV